MTGPEHPTPGLPDDTDDEATVLSHVRAADIVFLTYLDAWIDKTVRDGTLTPAKAASYREAIAARCAQLGETPNVPAAVGRLDLKPGDTLAVIAPIDDVYLVRQMSEHLAGFFEDTGVRAVVFPPRTEIKVLHPGPRTREYPFWGLPKAEAQEPVLQVERFETGNGTVFKVTHVATTLATSARTYEEALSALDELLPDPFKPLPPRARPPVAQEP